VTKVNVKPGDQVNENDVVLVLEAMKMESNIASPSAGTVKEVHVHEGASVTQGQLLVEFE
jgi:biotin carboxyl carrier protein